MTKRLGISSIVVVTLAVLLYALGPLVADVVQGLYHSGTTWFVTMTFTDPDTGNPITPSGVCYGLNSVVPKAQVLLTKQCVTPSSAVVKFTIPYLANLYVGSGHSQQMNRLNIQWEWPGSLCSPNLCVGKKSFDLTIVESVDLPGPTPTP